MNRADYTEQHLDYVTWLIPCLAPATAKRWDRALTWVFVDAAALRKRWQLKKC